MTAPKRYADRVARLRELKDSGGVKIFWHPCKVCGDIFAAWGFDNEWFCAEHREQGQREYDARRACQP